MCSPDAETERRLNGAFPPKAGYQSRPEEELSDLLYTSTRSYVSPHAIRRVLLTQWSEVAKLAHRIHEGK